jgi:hypothetical protein
LIGILAGALPFVTAHIVLRLTSECPLIATDIDWDIDPPPLKTFTGAAIGFVRWITVLIVVNALSSDASDYFLPLSAGFWGYFALQSFTQRRLLMRSYARAIRAESSDAPALQSG